MKVNSFPSIELFDEQQIFKEIIQVLRLKYFIKTENNIEILNSLAKNTNKNKRIVYQIVNSSKIPKSISEDSAIVQKKNQIKA